MQITLKLGARLRKALPAAGSAGTAFTLVEGARLSDLVEQLNLGEDPETLLIIVDDENVPPSGRAAFTLCDGQTVNILPPLTGG